MNKRSILTGMVALLALGAVTGVAYAWTYTTPELNCTVNFRQAYAFGSGNTDMGCSKDTLSHWFNCSAASDGWRVWKINTVPTGVVSAVCKYYAPGASSPYTQVTCYQDHCG